MYLRYGFVFNAPQFPSIADKLTSCHDPVKTMSASKRPVLIIDGSERPVLK
ncbi:hypothetical protein VQL36_17910 [Chengkuizengella sp. SCS-71B]|uniref:hypothetical protein n=1 Tax=Chengkuizengella sp. SCS-71B TaxID=3115290 RepID=UPI0032C24790